MPRALLRVPVKNHPGIYRRGGRYSYTYRDHRGRQRFGSAATIGEAKDAKAAKRADVPARSAVVPPGDGRHGALKSLADTLPIF